MWILPETNEFVFDHPFRAYVCGPSNSGKTKLLEKILLNREKLINKPIDRIVFCFREDQDSYNSLRNDDIEFHKGLIDSSIFDPKFNNLLIIDDLMDECKDSKEILKLFTVESHHRNISVFLVSQNIYTKGQCSRDINLNSSYMIIFKNPRDNIQISVLARQMFPNKSTAFMEAFKDATSIAHGYLFLDFNQKTNDKLRLQANILGPNRVIYVIDN